MKPIKSDVLPDANDETFNGNFTAIPKDMSKPISADADLLSNGVEYGEMNADDAADSGYINASGKAVEMARPDVEGSPTGAYTDIGAGRSSVVHKH